ncbi:hypothetical protein [Paenibacillus gorillae]|uniref:hypothetical protein n=1 Tax=Paenibacillus gorillae TaxID=1243662 RepID=UPI0004AC562B|nr:hypothetical protein [Paenibacillus gorillae]
MSSVFAVLALAAAAIGLEVPGLVKRKRKRELAVFLILLSIGSGLYIALALEQDLPNPFGLLKYAFGGTIG